MDYLFTFRRFISKKMNQQHIAACWLLMLCSERDSCSVSRAKTSVHGAWTAGHLETNTTGRTHRRHRWDHSGGRSRYSRFLFKHFVAYSTGEICIHTKHNMKDIGLLQTIKGWYSSTTYRTPKKIKKNTQKQTWNDSTFKSKIRRGKRTVAVC